MFSKRTIIILVVAAMIAPGIIFTWVQLSGGKLADDEIDQTLGLYKIPYSLNIPQSVTSDGPLRAHNQSLVEATIAYFEDGTVPAASGQIVLLPGVDDQAGSLVNKVQYTKVGTGRYSSARRRCQGVSYTRTATELTLNWKIWGGNKTHECSEHYVNGNLQENI